MKQGSDMMICLLLMSATEFSSFTRCCYSHQATEIFTHYSLDTFQLRAGTLCFCDSMVSDGIFCFFKCIQMLWGKRSYLVTVGTFLLHRTDFSETLECWTVTISVFLSHRVCHRKWAIVCRLAEHFLETHTALERNSCQLHWPVSE